MKKTVQRVFVVLCMIFLLIPLAGMTFFATNETKEKTELASFPDLVDEQGINLQFLSQSGEYFEDHFAFREPLITLNSVILRAIQSSNQPKVIIGQGGDLFFLGEIIDYQGLNFYDERDLFNIASNLRLIQDYITSKGIAFTLTIVPNKSEVRSEDVPSRYVIAETSSLERLEQALQEHGVHYVSLQETFDPSDYFLFDTHWNNQGALKAYNALMQSIGLAPKPIDLDETSRHEGDLSDMLYPSLNVYDDNPDSELLHPEISEENGIESVINPDEQGIALFYSDSFGEALLPLISNSFGLTQRHTLVPMNLIAIEQMHPQAVIIERAQRRMVFFEESAPIMLMPQLQPIEYDQKLSDSTIETSESGSFVYLSGIVDDPAFETDSRFYVEISRPDGSQAFYPVFYLGKNLYDDDGVLQSDLVDENAYRLKNHGYGLYLPQDALPEGSEISLLLKNSQQKAVCIQKSVYNKDFEESK